MSRAETLIAYHSRSATTRRVAQALAERLGADLEEIRALQSREGPLGYAQCGLEAAAGLAPAIHASHHEPSAYGLVVIGSPVWCMNLASPVRTWLMQADLKRSRVAFFCTMGGSGARRVFDTMAQLCGQQPAATLALTEAEVSAQLDRQLDAFVRALARKPAAGKAQAKPSRASRAQATPARTRARSSK